MIKQKFFSLALGILLLGFGLTGLARGAGGNVPLAPSNLSASAVSSSQINLAWTDNSDNETGFRIERSSDGLNFAEIAAVGANVTSYSQNGLPQGATYSYRVRASKVSGQSGKITYSAYSNTASATTPAPPAAPSNLTAIAGQGVSSSSTLAAFINLTWQDNSTNESAFQIERSTDGVNFSCCAGIAAANGTAFTDSSVTPGTTYFYRVNAVNGVGASGYSNVASATALFPLPATPSNLIATPGQILNSSGTPLSFIDLMWQDNSDNESSFQIARSTDGITFPCCIGGASANATTSRDSSLTAGVTYFYEVRAVNSAGASAYSNIASTTAL